MNECPDASRPGALFFFRGLRWLTTVAASLPKSLSFLDFGLGIC